MCHMAALRRTKRYVLKQAHNRALPDWSRRHFQKVTVCENKYRDVTNIVHYLTMWQMFLVSTLLPAASTTASTTLLTQCISHLHPVPTRLLNTSTNGSFCGFGGQVSSKLPKSARMAHLTRHTDAHPLSLGPPGAYHVHTGLSNDALPTRAQKLGCLRLGQNRREIPTALR